MQYKGTLITVKDMKKSKAFYKDVLGLNVVDDFGANVMLDGGIYLQTLDTWTDFIKTNDITLRNNAVELYFESDDMDQFIELLKGKDITYVHKLIEHNWGQGGIRIYDPDYHIIEVSESLNNVIKRFENQGMTVEQIAKRMDVSEEYVKRAQIK